VWCKRSNVEKYNLGKPVSLSPKHFLKSFLNTDGTSGIKIFKKIPTGTENGILHNGSSFV
jgi:hypothetical protein